MHVLFEPNLHPRSLHEFEDVYQFASVIEDEIQRLLSFCRRKKELCGLARQTLDAHATHATLTLCLKYISLAGGMQQRRRFVSCNVGARH